MSAWRNSNRARNLPLELSRHKHRAGRRMSGVSREGADGNDSTAAPACIAGGGCPGSTTMRTECGQFPGRPSIPKGVFHREAPLLCKRGEPGRYGSADAGPSVFRRWFACRAPVVLPFRRLLCLPAVRRGAEMPLQRGFLAAVEVRGRGRGAPRQAMPIPPA